MILVRFYVDPGAERYDGLKGWLDPNGKYKSWYVTYYDTLRKHAFITYFVGSFQYIPFPFKIDGETCYGYWQNVSFNREWTKVKNRKTLEETCKDFIEVDKSLCWDIESIQSPINGYRLLGR